MLSRFLSGVEKKTSTVAVVGLGYVGLPLALSFAEAGLKVLGVDLDASKVAAINEGRSLVQDVDSQVLSRLVDEKRFYAVTDYAGISQANAVILCVPTPLGQNREPDLSYIQSAVSRVLPHLQKGTLISLESTTYPGTTDEMMVAPLMEAGWTPGEDVFVCFSPERVDPGNRRYQVHNMPKVIGGVTPSCLQAGVALYGTCIEMLVPVSSPKVAEMAKLLENTFRSVNIAFINEMALLCERLGVSIWEVVAAASTKPFGFMPFFPGPGIGGHCIPLDPAYLAWKAKESKFYSRFIELAQDLNEGMPRHVARRVAEALNVRGKAVNGAKLLLLGMTYKPDVDDLRESPSLEVYELLVEAGADITVCDPYVEGFRDGTGSFIYAQPLSVDLLSQSDCVVVLTAHSCFDYDLIVQKSDLIFDTRHAIKRNSPSIFRLGEPFPGTRPNGRQQDRGVTVHS